MTHVCEINELNFDEEVLASERPVLLNFSNQWCGPCKSLAPVLEGLAAENLSTLKVGKLDIDGSPSLATRFGIRGAPTLLVFRDGKEVSRRLGAGSKGALLALLGR